MIHKMEISVIIDKTQCLFYKKRQSDNVELVMKWKTLSPCSLFFVRISSQSLLFKVSLV